MWDAAGLRPQFDTGRSRNGVTKGQAVTTGFGLVAVFTTSAIGRRVFCSSPISIPDSVVVKHRGCGPSWPETTRNNALILPPEVDVAPASGSSPRSHARFPPGLPVGVSSVSEAGILVQPLMERHRLEFVQVVDYGLSGILTAPGNVPGETSQGSR